MDDRELAELEAELTRRAEFDPPAELARHVGRRVAHELAAQRASEWRWYAAAVAAGLLLWANLSLVVSREPTYDVALPDAPPDRAAQLEQLVPGISHEEAARQALLMRGWQTPDTQRARNAAALGVSSF